MKMGYNLNVQILGCIYLLQFSMGLVFEVVGPTFDELQAITNSTSDAISIIFSFRSTGYVLGSIVGGGIFHFFVPLVSLSLAVLVSTLTTASIGFISKLEILYAIFTINGLATGIIDVGTNVWILRIFSRKSGPYLMALYTSFSFGTILAPLYTAPFLQEQPSVQVVSKLYIPYLVTGFFTLLSLIGLLVLLWCQLRLDYSERNFFARLNKRQDERTITSAVSDTDREMQKRRTISSREKTVVIIGAIMIMLYSGMEIIFGEYIVPVLTRNKLEITRQLASQIRSSSNMATTIGKVIFIGITAFIRPYRLLLLDSLLVIFSTIMLIIYFNTSVTAIWIFLITFGLGTSSLYPSIYPFIESFVTIDYFKGSFFICASGLTAIIYPIFVGSYLTSTPTILFYLHLLTMILTIFFIITINIMGSRLLLYQAKYPTTNTNENEEDNLNQNDQHEIE